MRHPSRTLLAALICAGIAFPARAALAQAPRVLFEASGPAAGARFGESLVAMGDFTGDGVPDVAIGMPFAGPVVADSTGMVLIYSGADPEAGPDLVLVGEHPGDRFGFALDGSADDDGDGFVDLMVTAPGHTYPNSSTAGTGRAYVFDGGPLRDAIADRVINAPALIYGFRVTGFGYSCSPIGDVDHDHHEDWVFGCEASSYPQFAVVQLSTERDRLTTDRVLSAGGRDIRVAGLGDCDGDGVPDIAVGVPRTSTGAYGQVVIYSALTTYGMGGRVSMGNRPVGFGATLTALGDINHDGHGDLGIGQPLAGGAAAVYLWLGNGSSNVVFPVSPPATPAPDSFGVSIAAGDLDGDGGPELVIGACGDSGGGIHAGATCVYDLTSGGGASLIATLRGSPADYSGFRVAVAGGRAGNRDWSFLTSAPRAGPAAWSGRVRWATLRTLSLVEPSGPWEWPAGGVGTVRWTGSAPADVLLTTDDRATWTTLAMGAGGADDNQISVPVPEQVGARARIRLRRNGSTGASTLDRDESEHTFSIVALPPPLASAGRADPFCDAAPGNDRTGSALATLAGTAESPGRLAVGAPYADHAGINSGSVELVDSAGTRIARLDGESAGDRFGTAISGAGDLDGDGVPDLAVGCPGHDGAGADAGAVYLFPDGRADGTPRRLDGATTGESFGSSLALMRDWDRDGRGDLAVGAPSAPDGTGAVVGRVALYRGMPGAITEPMLVIPAPRGYHEFGDQIATGDFNGDGASDLAVSALWTGGPVGRVFVYFGGVAADATPDRELISKLVGDGFGATLAAGDLNGDGVDDLVVGAPEALGGAGRVCVYLGSSDPSETPWRVYEGVAAGEGFGAAGCIAGDLDGDGVPDLVIAAPGANGGRGACRMILDPAAASAPDWNAADDDGLMGAALAAADLDGDGAPELYAGSPLHAAPSGGSGRVLRLDAARWVVDAPAPGDRWFAGTANTLRWRGAEPVDLDLSLDGGATWTAAARGAGGAATNAFELVAPSVVSDSVFLRLSATRPEVPGGPIQQGPIAIERAVQVNRFEVELTDAGVHLAWETTPGLGPTGLAAYRLYREPGPHGEARAPIGPDRLKATEFLVPDFERGATYVLVGVDGNGEETELARQTVATPLSRLRAWPVPSTEFGTVQLEVFPPVDGRGRTAGDFRVRLYDAGGRVVRDLAAGSMATRVGGLRLSWDRRTSGGTQAPAGVYFVRAESPSMGFRMERRIVLLR